MTYGPSTNRLMTAEEYARLDRIRAHAMLSSVERHYPDWSDATTPRTDRPVRFRRVAIRKRNVWGTGWDHYSRSETFRYGYAR